MKPSTRRARTLTALGAVAATVAAVLVAGPGYDASQVRMLSGAVWLASNRTGQATLVDGATAEVTAQVPVAPPDSSLSIAQQGAVAYALNRATGELKRVNGATEEVSEPVAVLPASDGLAVKLAPDVLYGVDVHSGMVAAFEPGTLATKGAPKPLADQNSPDGPVVDDRGRLWAIDRQNGDLVWLTGGERRTRSAAARSGASRLTITRNQPALVDPERGTAELLDPDTGAVTRSVRLDLRSDDAMVVNGSSDRSRMLIATGGALVLCDFDISTCAKPVTISAPGSDLGAPVEVHGHAVVPDHSTGRVAIVDLATSRVVAQRELFDHPAEFELLARDGIVFFNDPDSNRAGVLDLAGGVRTIAKYAEGHPEDDAAPTPDRRTQADQVTTVDNRKQKPGLGTPGLTTQPSPTNPAPTPPSPAASIVVRPSSRGVVGDEFEVTVVLQPSTRVASTRWWFGDGAEATGTTVRHRWQQPGTFTIRAAATLDTGVQVPPAETTVTVDTAGAPPRITQLNVRRPRPVIGESVRFSADSTGNPDKWAWRIIKPGSNTPEVTAQTPEFQHAFTAPGTYTLTLTIVEGTQSAESSRQVTVAQGAVKAWGSNLWGETNVPPAAGSGVVAIDAGMYHTLALKSDGSVIAWGGDNDEGQASVPATASNGVVAIATGSHHSLALRKDGSVVAWGSDYEGESSVPPQARSGVVAIAGGWHHSLALKADGSVIGWGSNEYGQAVAPPEARSGVVAMAVGQYHSLVVKPDGSVVAWGDNDEGEVSVPPEAKTGVTGVCAGLDHSVAVTRDGSVIGWGDNYFGQISIPPAAKSGVITIDCTMVHGLGLKADGSVVAWGDNADGEASVPPAFSKDALAIAAGQGFSVVLL